MGLTLKSIHRIFIFIGFLFILGGCVVKARPPFSSAASELAEGSLFVASGESTDVESFLEQAAASDYILIGEAHSSPCDHLVQSRLLSALAKALSTVSVGLEMISYDFQPQLDSVNNGQIPLADFAAAVNWSETWGYDFDLYRPIIDVAYEHAVPLYALNVPRHIVRKVSRGGVEALTEQERQRWIPVTIIPPSEAQRASLMEMLEAHRSMMEPQAEDGSGSAKPSATEQKPQAENQADGVRSDPSGTVAASGMTGRMDRFFLVQSLWDTAMAERAVAVRRQQGSPVVILAGSGHVEFGWGLAHRLRTLDPEARVLLVAPWRAMEDPDPLEADFRFYCPVTHKSRMGFTLTMVDGGAKVVAVALESPAARAGFQAQDVIVSIMDTPVDTMWVMHKAAVKAAQDKEQLRFIVQRDGTELLLIMPSQSASD